MLSQNYSPKAFCTEKKLKILLIVYTMGNDIKNLTITPHISLDNLWVHGKIQDMEERMRSGNRNHTHQMGHNPSKGVGWADRFPAPTFFRKEPKMINTCLLFLLFSAALAFGLWGVSPVVSWTTAIVGKSLMMKIAGGMMFVGFAGFVTMLCVGLISLIDD